MWYYVQSLYIWFDFAFERNLIEPTISQCVNAFNNVLVTLYQNTCQASHPYVCLVVSQHLSRWPIIALTNRCIRLPTYLPNLRHLFVHPPIHASIDSAFCLRQQSAAFQSLLEYQKVLLIMPVDYIINNIDNGNLCDMELVDLRKAFDNPNGPESKIRLCALWPTSTNHL